MSQTELYSYSVLSTEGGSCFGDLLSSLRSLYGSFSSSCRIHSWEIFVYHMVKFYTWHLFDFLQNHPKPFSSRSSPTPAMSSKKWSMHPDLHSDVSHLLHVDNLHLDFHRQDDFKNCIQQYDTNIMGRFTCPNSRCRSSGWSSKKIAITIRMYAGNKYNARVYNQHCLKCNHLGEMSLDDSYADRVAYRLKKWSGVKLATPDFSGGSSRGPHLEDLCEGCKAGHCNQS